MTPLPDVLILSGEERPEYYDAAPHSPDDGPGAAYVRRAGHGGQRLLVGVAVFRCETCGAPLFLFGVPEEVEYGWSGGEQVEDVTFSSEHNVYADCLHFALRVDVNKVPAALVKSLRIREEQALVAASPSGFINKS